MEQPRLSRRVAPRSRGDGLLLPGLLLGELDDGVRDEGGVLERGRVLRVGDERDAHAVGQVLLVPVVSYR